MYGFFPSLVRTIIIIHLLFSVAIFDMDIGLSLFFLTKASSAKKHVVFKICVPEGDETYHLETLLRSTYLRHVYLP